MNPIAYVLDPTATDQLSAVRGVGRYMQTLHDSFGAFHTEQLDTATGLHNAVFAFTSDYHAVPPDAVLINPFFNIFQKPLKFSRLARRQITVIHDVIPLKYKKNFPVGLKGTVFKYINKWLLKYSDLIVTDSEASKKDIMFYLKIPEKKIRIIYPTVPKVFLPHLDTHPESIEHHHPFHKEADRTVPEYSELPHRAAGVEHIIGPIKDYILYVGDASWNKNLPVLAQAIQKVNIPLVCVGNIFANREEILKKKPHPWQLSLFSFLKMTYNNPLFLFPGFVPDIDLMLLYKHARMNVLPSLDEGFGLPYIEAGYMSTPSVLADIPVFHEIARSAAIFANPHDPASLSQKISELYFDNVRQEKMSIEVFDRAQQFDPARFTQGWISAVQSVM